jgi:hypothetical protein
MKNIPIPKSLKTEAKDLQERRRRLAFIKNNGLHIIVDSITEELEMVQEGDMVHLDPDSYKEIHINSVDMATYRRLRNDYIKSL